MRLLLFDDGVEDQTLLDFAIPNQLDGDYGLEEQREDRQELD